MRILLIAPYFMNLYLDVKNELEHQGHEVCSLEDKGFKNDPFLIRNKQLNLKEAHKQEELNKNYWEEQLCGLKDKRFDVLLQINGTSFSPVIIETLKANNPDIRTILYLWDRAYQNYYFERFFKYFDSISTFDRVDSEHYGIKFLPNYWVPSSTIEKKYDLSGFGTYRKDRYEMFKHIYDLSFDHHLKEYIRLYCPTMDTSIIGRLKRLIGKYLLGREYISLVDYKSKIITHTPLKPDEFRSLIYSSDCIIDTYNTFQEGMTPRFMWALGAGVKIITTNANAKNYDFYSEEQIYILGEREDSLLDFIKNKYVQNSEQQEIVNNYRIDNWIKTLLS